MKRARPSAGHFSVLAGITGKRVNVGCANAAPGKERENEIETRNSPFRVKKMKMN